MLITCLVACWRLLVPLPLCDSTEKAAPYRPTVARKADLADVAHQLLPSWKRIQPHDSTHLNEGGNFRTFLVQPGYSLPTGFLIQGLANIYFARPGANVSSILSTLSYTTQKQAILTLTPSIWSRHNRAIWAGDFRLMHYPQATFGLGVLNTTQNREISMDYAYLRLHQRLFWQWRPKLFLGVGYALDLHWNIQAYNRQREVTRISHYRYGISGRSVSSGPLVGLLYDSRDNALNTQKGQYIQVLYKPSLSTLGSDQTYHSLGVDSRYYIQLSPTSPNVLAIWAYSALTLSGDPPFLDLPSTGWDAYNNLGRGYIQGRFRGMNLLYLESEYRFRISANGLLGGVIFANAQTVSEPSTHRFQQIAPAGGIGLRLKLNKVSGTNIAIDYAIGREGSHGIFFNLGEVF